MTTTLTKTINSSLRTTFGPLFLMMTTPVMVLLMWYTNVHLNGSFEALFTLFKLKGFTGALASIWSPVVFGSKTAWIIILSFTIFELILMKFAPGKLYLGPLTANGYTPKYKANGVSSYIITLCTFYLLSFQLKLFSPTIIYDHLGEILGGLTFFSLLFCLFLYFKGKYFPSGPDHSVSGNFIFDYYWGTELYPQIGNVNIKMFTNCRFAMMSWPLLLLSFMAKQSELYGLSNAMVISVVLQLIYITKFFLWETGYLASLDIMYDRAGYYICWGCLVWVPAIYTSPTMYLVHHPNQLPNFIAWGIFLVGAISILMNYDADRQRQKVRSLNGQCNIWGKRPKLTHANYSTTNGDERTSILLASGYWGIARHFHYVLEILGALCWALPALFVHFSPYFYVVFLTILLVDRSKRDDIRCGNKYGKGWDEHCQKVPYKLIPFVY